MISKEAILHRQVCQYLRIQYPDVIFRTDFASGIKMSMHQAVKHKQLQSGKAYPDLFIAEPKGVINFNGFGDNIDRTPHYRCAGLFIELKAVNIWKKDGTLRASDHLKAQADVLKALEDRGYVALFAVGFEQAKRIIDSYMRGEL